MRPTAVLAGYLVRCPLGGYAWQTLHYLKGLQSCGYEPYFYEDLDFFPDCFDPINGTMYGPPDAGLKIAGEFLAHHGFGANWIFRDTVRDQWHGRSAEESRAILDSADLLITLAPVNRLPRPIGERRIFVDIDPGFTQAQMGREANVRELVRDHDLHFTFGESIGQQGCDVPTAGISWLPTRQPVVTELWAPTTPAVGGAAYSTIGRWAEARRDVEIGGILYSWCKREEWLKLIDLPTRTRAQFCLATDVGKSGDDLALLTKHGWSTVDPILTSRDPERYRNFIRGSRGELTVAKGVTVQLRTGWFSDRSACYLAAGRPVITQDTAFGQYIPVGDGLFAFRTVDDAATAIKTIEANYERQSAAAVRLAKERFEAADVVGRMLSEL